MQKLYFTDPTLDKLTSEIITLFISLLSLIYLIKSFHTTIEEKVPLPNNIMAIWVWNTDNSLITDYMKRDDFLNYCHNYYRSIGYPNLKINRIYIGLSLDLLRYHQVEILEFIKKADELGIAVEATPNHALEWLDNFDTLSLKEFIHLILNFNRINHFNFKGIILDFEPRERFEIQRCIKFAKIMHDSIKNYNNSTPTQNKIALGYAIARWYGGLNNYTVENAIAKYCDYICTMEYWNGKHINKLKNAVWELVTNLRNHATQFVIGVETIRDVPDCRSTFYGRGEGRGYSCLSKAIKELEQYFTFSDLSYRFRGFAIHCWGDPYSGGYNHLEPGGCINNYLIEQIPIEHIILDEKFNDGFHNWSLFGYPKPTLRNIDDNWVLDNNGDGLCSSGIISFHTFRFPNIININIECDILLQITNTTGCWAGAKFGITRSNVPIGKGICSQEDFPLTIYFGIDYAGDACWGTPEERRRHAYFAIGIYTKSGKMESPKYLNADQYVNSWHRFKIIIGSDRCCEFFVDNKLIYASKEPVSSSALQDKKVILFGRSSGSAGKAYHDNLRISIYH